VWREEALKIFIGVLTARICCVATRAADGDTSKIDFSTISLPPRAGSCRRCARWTETAKAFRWYAARPFRAGGRSNLVREV